MQSGRVFAKKCFELDRSPRLGEAFYSRINADWERRCNIWNTEMCRWFRAIVRLRLTVASIHKRIIPHIQSECTYSYHERANRPCTHMAHHTQTDMHLQRHVDALMVRAPLYHTQKHRWTRTDKNVWAFWCMYVCTHKQWSVESFKAWQKMLKI